MDRRLWILLAIGGAALVAWRYWPAGSGEPAPAPAATAPDSAAEGGLGAAAAVPGSPGRRRAPPAPVRMQARSGQAPLGPRAGVSVIFETEARNDEWAAPREEEVRVRAGRVLAAASAGRRPAATLGAVECRSRSCRVAIAGDDPGALARAVEQLGEEGGFYRFAEQMTVEATERGEGGPRAVNIYLRFAR
jgi:hypothetical protein